MVNNYPPFHPKDVCIESPCGCRHIFIFNTHYKSANVVPCTRHRYVSYEEESVALCVDALEAMVKELAERRKDDNKSRD